MCLHTGSAQWAPIPAPGHPVRDHHDAVPRERAWSRARTGCGRGIPVRFPRLNITLAEGGLGWVAMLADRADYVLAHSASGREGGSWKSDLLPSEVLRRNFWFCSIDDPSAFGALDAIGVEHILVESDYPHADSTWPDTQAGRRAQRREPSADDAARITRRNAAELFRHPLPDGGWPATRVGGCHARSSDSRCRDRRRHRRARPARRRRRQGRTDRRGRRGGRLGRENR